MLTKDCLAKVLIGNLQTAGSNPTEDNIFPRKTFDVHVVNFALLMKKLECVPATNH